MVEGDTEGKIEKVVSKTAPKTQQSSSAADEKVKMHEGRYSMASMTKYKRRSKYFNRLRELPATIWT